MQVICRPFCKAPTPKAHEFWYTRILWSFITKSNTSLLPKEELVLADPSGPNLHLSPSLFPQVCGCGLAQSGFFFNNQEYICTQDYQQLYGTRCDSCRDFITGEVISALGRTYHPKCFVCSLCR
jgi:hypothetical protein